MTVWMAYSVSGGFAMESDKNLEKYFEILVTEINLYAFCVKLYFCF